MAMSNDMRMNTNRNRVISVVQKHDREWLPCAARLIRGYGTSFVSEYDSRIVVEFHTVGFVVAKWDDPFPHVRSWAIAPYEGKMYRNLTIMLNNLMMGRTRGNSQILYGSYPTFLIPMDRIVREFAMVNLLSDSLINSSLSGLVSNWQDFVYFPETIVFEVHNALGIPLVNEIPNDPPVTTLEPLITNLSSEETLVLVDPPAVSAIHPVEAESIDSAEPIIPVLVRKIRI